MRLIPAAAKILAQLIQGKWVIYIVAPSSETPRRAASLIAFCSSVRWLVRDRHESEIRGMHLVRTVIASRDDTVSAAHQKR